MSTDSTAREKFAAYAKAELEGIETALKQWFITRRFRLERALAIKSKLDEHNFTGLSMTNIASLPPREAAMWRDLVTGQPHVESSLSQDAKTRKVELYREMFDKATDAENVCRPSGMTFLRCLETSAECAEQFTAFDACRADLIKQQRDAIDSRLVQQDVEDKRAKSLFDRRQVLLDTLSAVASETKQ
jgi:hypothetical protein